MSQNVGSRFRSVAFLILHLHLFFVLQSDISVDWSSGNNPIVANQGGSWSATIDAESQDDWAIRIGQAISTNSIMEEGNSLQGPPTWGATELIATENATVKAYVKSFSQHAYPGGDTTTLMQHGSTVSKMDGFKVDIASATAAGKEYVYGETNSSTPILIPYLC